MKLEFNVEVKEIGSVNKAWIPCAFKTKTGKIRAWMRKHPDAIKWQNEYKNKIKNVLGDTINKIAGKIDFKHTSITYIFYMNNSLYKRDTDNCIKLWQDALAEILGFNDYSLITIKTAKRYVNSNNEYIKTIIETNTLDTLEVPIPSAGLINYES